ncbi:peptidase inhibitor family I36 protein [Nonomuraea sp. NEAU-A123]|uniref:peptidase inhibitor family I36 protein n=1 Tax=Nonomuraea sp. NEAU-A123 TaxID=2839649 RepID=UPI001BE4647D|nr:peptidase inhibitor family I36 protein [Nonomuraea sp. NEAU-A123]MBT2232630.1 peptidase inhibitor family I36 protein [Nonomuraea sp. NEAU-A123]
MKRATVRSAGVVALVLASLVGVGSTAQAETSQALSTCVLGLCLYENDYWAGAEEEFMFEGYVCYNSLTVNNKASSMRNNSGARVQFYDSANCSGAYGYAASPHSEDADLTNNGFDNKTSSIKYIKV